MLAMLLWLAVLGIPLLPFPGGQGFRDLAMGGSRERLALQGIVLLRRIVAQYFANTPLVAGLRHDASLSGLLYN